MPRGVYRRRPETLERMRQSMLAKWQEPGYRRDVARGVTASWENLEVRERHRASRVGKPHPNRSHSQTAEAREKIRQSKLGAKNPQWRGGLPRVYGHGWRPIRRKILAQAGHVCESCKKDTAVHVHHKLPMRFFEDINAAHAWVVSVELPPISVCGDVP